MAKFTGFCPRCTEHVPQERYIGGFAICECGWRDETKSVRADLKLERETSVAFIAFGFAAAIVVGHFFAWGSHALSIPGLKIAEFTGMLSAPGYKELAKACLDLGKLNQAERAYFDMYKRGGDREGLALLANLQLRLKKLDVASSNYAVYFQLGGRDVEAMLGYGRVLEQMNQIEPALKQYDAAINATPGDVLPLTATSGAVRLLISQRRLEEAYERILRFHASAENAKGYLNSEKGNLEAWLGAPVATAIQARVSGVQAQAAPEPTATRGPRRG